MKGFAVVGLLALLLASGAMNHSSASPPTGSTPASSAVGITETGPGVASGASPRAEANRGTSLAAEERLKLAEYTLAEAVQERVLKSFGLYATLIAGALAFVGFFGATMLLDSISRRVEKTLKETIDKDVDAFRSRVHTTMGELQVAIAESKFLSGRSKSQLEELQAHHAELESLGARYNDLHAQIASIQTKVKDAAAAAAKSVEKTETLRDAMVRSISGSLPVVLQSGFNWEQGAGVLQGSKFGQQKGGLSVGVSAVFVAAPGGEPEVTELPPFRIKESGIRTWTDNVINFQLDPDEFKLILEFKDSIQDRWTQRDPDKTSADRTIAYKFVIHTADDLTVSV